RKMLKALKEAVAVGQSTKVSENTNDDLSVIRTHKVKLLSDLMDSKISIEGTQYLKQDKHINFQKCVDNNDLVIENTGLADTNHIERIQQHESQGHRIIDIAFFNAELHRVFDNHARGIDCLFKDWELINTHRIGFKTQFSYKCKMCNYEANFWSHPTDCKNMDINTAITAGTITTGIDYAQMKEIFAAANRMVVGRRGRMIETVPMIHFPELEPLLVIAQGKFSSLAFATNFVRYVI
ncbi:hypothetical protein ALC62_11500, partial [Cyphomyrmex costatus]